MDRASSRTSREPSELLDIDTATETLPLLEQPPVYGEIVDALKELRSGKGPGIDELPAELLKCNTESCASVLHVLFTKIWNEE